jgi:PhnB protein
MRFSFSKTAGPHAATLPVRSEEREEVTMAGGRPGFHTVTPYLIHPDVAGLVTYIERAFGGEEMFRSRGAAGGTHVEVRVGDSMLMVGGKDDSNPLPTMLFLYVDDVDADYRQALAAGGTSLMEPAESGDGDRRAGVQDPFGNQWWIGTHLSTARPA